MMISLWKPTHLLVRTRTNLQQRKIDFYLHCQQKDPVPLLKGSTNIQCFYQDAIGTILMIHVKSLANKIAKMSCSANSDLASAFFKRRQEINQSLVIYQKYIKSFLFFTYIILKILITYYDTSISGIDFSDALCAC